jgi:hypothetical protein
VTYEEYVEAQQEINLALFQSLLVLLNPLRLIAINPSRWIALLAAILTRVQEARTETAELAREFYDSQRQEHFPGEPRWPVYTADHYESDWLYEAMEEVRETFAPAGASESSMAKVIHIALKETENAGRNTIRDAVEGRGNQRKDPRVVGWARVEGGGESCAFCTMLISRGPVYVGEDGARNAGLQADEKTALDIWNEYDRTGDDSALMGLMSRWHENCDCKVVPVFDRANWPGRDRYLEAERLWIEATRGKSGKAKLQALRELLKRRQPGDQESPPLAA